MPEKYNIPFSRSPGNINFFIMRHAESIATINKEAFSQRVPHEIPLTKRGHEEARMGAECIKRYYAQNPLRKVKVIYCDAIRIVETKDEVISVLSDSIVSISVCDQRSDELEHGKFNSLTSKAMRNMLSSVYDKFYYKSLEGQDEKKLLESFKVRLPNGESKEDLLKKTIKILASLEKNCAVNEDILFIGHGANCRAIEAVLTGKDGKWLANEFDTMGRAEIKLIEIKLGSTVHPISHDFFKSPRERIKLFSRQPIHSRVAILGAGAAGTAVLANIIPKLSNGSEIVVFEQTGNFGPGFVYDICLPPCFLLNRNVSGMNQLSMPKTNPDGTADNFLQWIIKNKATIMTSYEKAWFKLFPNSLEALRSTLRAITEESVVPRSLYGRYLSSCFEAYCKYANSKGIRVIKSKSKVQNVSNDQIILYKRSDLESITFDYIILATGPWLKPKPPEYSDVSTYYHDPMFLGFAPNDMSKIAGKTVLIRGTGLSAMDAAIMSLELGAKKVSMFSRHGKLRSIKGRYVIRPLQHMTIENLEKLSKEYGGDGRIFRLNHVFELMNKDLQDAGLKVDWKEVIEPRNPVKSAIDEFNACDRGDELVWRSVFESSFHMHQQIYSRLHDDDKVDFIEKWFSTFMAYNSTITVDSFRRYVEYFKSGKLEVVAGEADVKYIKPAICGAAKFNATFKPGSKLEKICADIFINAIGQDKDAVFIDYIQNMADVRKHLEGYIINVSYNRYGGIKTNATHNVIDDKNEVDDNIFAIGALANGDELNQSGFDIIYEMSKRVADQIEVSLYNNKDKRSMRAFREEMAKLSIDLIDKKGYKERESTLKSKMRDTLYSLDLAATEDQISIILEARAGSLGFRA